MCVSMERWLKQFDFMTWDPDAGQFNSVSKADAMENGVYDRWANHTPMNGQPIYRRALSYIYGGVAGTMNPAQPMSRFIAPAPLKAAASLEQSSANDKIFQLLLKRHGEVHEQFAISSPEQQADLIREHTRITRAVAAYVAEGKVR